MSIADKLQTVAENQQKVYDAGKQAEYDRFWDLYQDNGNRADYRYAFAGHGWNDDTFNPKYPLVCTNTKGIFQSSKISEVSSLIKTGMNVNGSEFEYSGVKKIGFLKLSGVLDRTFFQCQNLTTIETLEVTPQSADYAFHYASALENINWVGSIACNINLTYSPNLTVESAISIINCLESLLDNNAFKEYELTISFHGDVWERLDALGYTAPDDYPWRDYVTQELCWNI